MQSAQTFERTRSASRVAPQQIARSKLLILLAAVSIAALGVLRVRNTLELFR